jgi:hypothetical protein
MKRRFNRFEKQCVTCACYIENAEEGEAIDPDSDCTLNHDTNAGTECEDHNDLDE